MEQQVNGQEALFINYKGQVADTLEKLIGVVNTYGESSGEDPFLKKLEDIFREKFFQVNPNIIVYGIYNAGKSSLINELLREHAAEVADRPMTDKVTSYSWNGYVIDDTPGVGAPIAHEEVTMERLRNADVVLFVMSANGSNEKVENYERMKDIVESGKKLIIVLNDKDGILSPENAAQIQEITDKVAKNMASLGIEDVNQKYQIVMVNLKRAEKGRLENKANLYAKSNMAELEAVIASELRRTSSFDLMRTGLLLMEDEIDTYLNSEIFADNENINAIESMLNTVADAKNLLSNNMQQFIGERCTSVAKEFSEKAWAVLQTGKNQDRLKEIGEVLVDRLNQECEQHYTNLLTEVNASISSNISILREELEHIQASFDESDLHSDGPTLGIGTASSTIPLFAVDLSHMLDGMSDVTSTIKKIAMAIAGGSGLGIAAALGIDLAAITGSLGATSAGVAGLFGAAGVAGVALPFLAPIGLAAGALAAGIAFFSKSKEQKEQEAEDRRLEAANERKRILAQAEQDLYHKVFVMFDSINQELYSAYSSATDMIFEKFSEPINKALESIQGQEADRAKLRAALLDAKENLVDIRNRMMSSAQ